MKKNFYHFFLVFTLMMSLLQVVHAGDITFASGKNDLRYQPLPYRHLTVTAALGKIEFREVITKLGPFTELYIPGYCHSSVVGDPDLPTFGKLIEIPVNATPEISITRQDYIDLDLSTYAIHTRLIPTQASVSKGITDPSQIPFVLNEATYQLNRFTGAPLVQINPAGTLRTMNLVQLQISPVQYNPVTNQLRVYTALEFKITYRNTDVAATQKQKSRYASVFYDNLYRQIPNFHGQADSLVTSSPVTYVIVSPRMFEAALQPLVKWKTLKGFRVVEAYTDDPAVGSTTTSIKAYLQNLYQNPPLGLNPPSFILFVGDVAQIPAFMNNGQATDLRYCEYTGDNLPEVYYGRFSASLLTQLQPYIEKTIEYEKYEFPDDSFLNEDVMVAGYDAGGSGLTYGNGQINYGTNEYFNTAHGLTSHTYLQPEPSGANYSQQIRTDISNGVCYANYTAHGSEQGWADPQFVISQIAALQNDHKYSLLVGNCCLTSKYNVNCFAEEVTRASHKGAIGYIGASNNSLWNEDFWWGCGLKAISTTPVYNADHLGAYDVTFHDHGEPTQKWFTTMAQMVVGGNLAVQESSSSNKLYYWEIYNLMGDPSLSIYYSVPPAINAVLPPVAIVGATNITINTEPWSYAAFSLNDSTLLDARCADSTGIVTLQFPALNTPGMGYVVITKQNRKPLFDSIPIIQPAGPYITLGQVTINDSVGGNNNHLADFGEQITLNLTINNVGMQATTNLQCVASTTDTNIVIINNTFSFGAIPANSVFTGSNAFNITIRNNVADLYSVPITLTFTDGADSWTRSYTLILHAPVLAVGEVTVIDPLPGGNNNGVLDPGETAMLKIKVLNTGHATVGNGFGQLLVSSGSSVYILVNGQTTVIGNIPALSSTYSYFTVVTNGITPSGTSVLMNFLVTAGQQGQYGTGKDLQMTIGLPPQLLINNATVTTCNNMFYDAGGPDQNYNDNENFIMTIHAGNPGAKLKAEFTMFEVESGAGGMNDYLSIYDGASMVDPLIGTYYGTGSPNTITATNSYGSLTFMFHSNYTVNKPGWSAHLTCVGGTLGLLSNSFPANVCEGGSSQLVAIANGGTGNYTYQWNPATYLNDPTSATPISTPLTNITYTVTVSDGTSILTSAPISLSLAAKPEAPVISQTGTLLESSVATGNQWYFNGILIPNATGQTYQPVASGDYTARIVDQSTLCESDPSNFITWLITGTAPESNPMRLRLYPNPAQDLITVEYSLPAAGEVTLSILNTLGEAVTLPLSNLTRGEGLNREKIRLSQVPDGIYFCILKTSGNQYVSKFVINK